MECTSASSCATAPDDAAANTSSTPPPSTPTAPQHLPPSPPSPPPCKKSRAPPASTWRARARSVPGAGTLARLTLTCGVDCGVPATATPSPFAAAAWTPFSRGATGSACSDDDGSESEDDDGVRAGPPPPPPAKLTRAPKTVVWSDNDLGCNSSDSEWARAAMPRPASDVLLPWDV